MTATVKFPSAGSQTALRTDPIQTFTVPSSGRYRLECWGAQGGPGSSSYVGGMGAYVAGEMDLVGGEVLCLIVGSKGTRGGSAYEGGGGGGSFIYRQATGELLLAAGGGGGGSNSSSGVNGTTSTSGTVGTGSGAGAGGTNGNGGSGSFGASGGGWLTTGGTATWSPNGTVRPGSACAPGKVYDSASGNGQAYGGLGEPTFNPFGGFGGGAGAHGNSYVAGGGGGGYSGGSGGLQSGYGGGGGGSYYHPSMVNTAGLSGVKTGHGEARISLAGDALGLHAIVLSGVSGLTVKSLNGVTWYQELGPNTTSTVNSMAFSRKLQQYVAVTSTGQIFTCAAASLTSGQWQLQTSGTTGQIRQVIWITELGKYVAVGYTGYIATSTDGITWTKQTYSFTGSIMSVAWSPTLMRMVMVQSASTAYSSDGITWTAGNGVAGTVQDIAWIPSGPGGPGAFITAASSGYIYTSPDGITWTQRTNPLGTTYNANSVAGAPNGTVWVGMNSGRRVKSTDGGATFVDGTVLTGVSSNYGITRYVPELGIFVMGAGSYAYYIDGSSGVAGTVVTTEASTISAFAFSPNAAPSVSNVTANPSTVQVGDPVTISWNFSDPDSDQQVRYQLRWRKVN